MARWSPHFDYLEQEYRKVGDRTWVGADFDAANLKSSRDVFTTESLLAREPHPRDLEVLAVVSGLPFPAEFRAPLQRVQRQISEILDGTLHYWVAPANFGLEHCVLKWPGEQIGPESLRLAQDVLGEVKGPAFSFAIHGVQVNPDGCVVAKGFDEGGAIFHLRERLRAKLPFLPSRQSGWAHVPLGRILEPAGSGGFASLKTFIAQQPRAPIARMQISDLKLVHETRWYMERRTVLAEYSLNSSELTSK